MRSIVLREVAHRPCPACVTSPAAWLFRQAPSLAAMELRATGCVEVSVLSPELAEQAAHEGQAGNDQHRGKRNTRDMLLYRSVSAAKCYASPPPANADWSLNTRHRYPASGQSYHAYVRQDRAGTRNTGTNERRRILSAVLPSRTLETPDLPCELRTTTSTPLLAT